MDESINPGQFQIRLRKGDWELEISAPEKDFVLDEWERLVQFPLPNLPLNSSSEKSHTSVYTGVNGDVENARNLKPQTIVEFIKQFKFQNNLEKILALGYWCEIRLRQSGFTKEDIAEKYKETKEAPPKNIGRDLRSLVSKGFLMQDNKSEIHELTSTGIREIEQQLSGQG